jgi:hypothetical protein
MRARAVTPTSIFRARNKSWSQDRILRGLSQLRKIHFLIVDDSCEMTGFLFTFAPMTISAARSAYTESALRLLDDERVSRTQANFDSFIWLCALILNRIQPRLGPPFVEC